MIFNFRSPRDWAFLGVASAAIFFNFIYEAPAQTQSGAWRLVERSGESSGVTFRGTLPPICRQKFATSDAVISCLLSPNSKWNFGYYTSNVGQDGIHNSKVADQQKFERFVQDGIYPSVSLSSGNLYRFRNLKVIIQNSQGGNLSFSTTGSNGNVSVTDVSKVFLSELKTGSSGSSCSNSSGCKSILFGADPILNHIFLFGLEFLPNEQPDPEQPEEDACEDTSLTLAMSAAELSEKKPTPGTEFENSGCLYVWERPRNTPEAYASACLTPIGGETLCFAKGLKRLDPPAPKAYEEITKENPLLVKVGSTAAEQKALKAPEKAKDLIGWGGAFGAIVPLASQLPVVGTVVQAASQVSPDAWSAWLGSFNEGLVKFELDYKKEDSDQDYYHPGNHTEGGSNLGAFDRDWGKTEYDPNKAWNWNTKPATEIEDTGKLAVIEQPNGAGSGGSGTYVTNINNSNSTTINYPPGVTAPGGNPSAPPDSSVPSDPGNGQPGDEEGEGDYPKGTRFYEPKYPDGLKGVWGDFKEDIMQKSGMNEFFQAFQMPQNVATADLCFNFNFDMGSIINLGEQGFCISENIILIVKALLIISAFLYARRLVFGG